MSKAGDLMVLAITAYRQGEYSNAAKFFTDSLGSEDLDSFVDEIVKPAPSAARTGTVPVSQNTLSPSLASASEIVEKVEASFRASSSFVDEGDEEIHERCTFSEISASAGPVRIK